METVEKVQSVWEFLELENPHAQETQALYSWGTNCDRADNPFILFLDLIGWSDGNIGEQQTTIVPQLGYCELGYLADALNEYANNPSDVMKWVDELMATDEV